MAKNKQKTEKKDNTSFFKFKRINGKLHDKETPYKAPLGDHVKMRSIMAKLDNQLRKEADMRKKSKEK